MSRTSAGIQYNARSMNGIISINADEITCSGTITSDLVKANNLLEADTPEDITALWTFNGTLPTSTISPTTAYQFTNKTYVDGAISGSLSGYVTLSTAQTISGVKTYSANLRLLNTRNLYFGTTTGGILNYTLPNMYYDINSGGSHYFFVNGSPNLRIETAGLFIENTKYINWFSGSWLYENGASSRFEYNVPTGFNHSLRINNVEKLKLDDDGNGSTLTFQSGPLIREYTPFSWLYHNIPLGWIYKYDVDGTTALQLSSSGILVAGGGTISIQSGSGGSLILDDAFVGGRISGDNGGGIRFDADVGAGFNFFVNGIPILTAEPTKVIHPTDTICQFGITGSSIGYSSIATSLQYKIPTGTYYHKWYQGSTELMSLADGTYGLRTTDIDIFLTRGKHLYMDTSNNGIWIDLTGNFNVMCEPTKSIVLNAGAQQMVSVDATGLIMGVSSLPSTFPKIYADYSKANWIDGNTSSLRFNCSSIGSHVFLLNNTLLGYYNTSGFTMSTNNSYLQLGTTSTATIKHDTATTSLQYKTLGSYNHMFYIDGALYYEMRTDTFRMLRGWQCKLGATGAYVSNNLNTSWNNPVAGLSCWIDTTRLGTFTISDYRVKECIVPARPVLDRLCQVKMIEYEMKDISIFKKSGLHHGFIAHELAELFPELNNIVAGEKDALTEDGLIQPQSVQPEMTNLYLSAIQELNSKIEAQQKQIDGLLVAMAKLLSP